jgi:hypothetical protein
MDAHYFSRQRNPRDMKKSLYYMKHGSMRAFAPTHCIGP